MTHLTMAIAATKTLTFVFGAVITYLSLVAYRRTAAPELRALGIGFAVVTVGSILGGSVDLAGDVLQLSGSNAILYGVFVQSVLTMAGFGIITYSLYRD